MYLLLYSNAVSHLPSVGVHPHAADDVGLSHARLIDWLFLCAGAVPSALINAPMVLRLSREAIHPCLAS